MSALEFSVLLAAADMARRRSDPNTKEMRRWTLDAYEAVSDALAVFREDGSFSEILNFMGERRRELALQARRNESELFGVRRDAQLMPEKRTRTTAFGPGTGTYESALSTLR